MPDELSALHQRLTSGDRTASGELAGRVVELLCTKIQRGYPGADEQIIADGVIDSVLEYCGHPERATVATGSALQGLLATAAWRNVANAVRSEQRRKRREAHFGRETTGAGVEHEPALGNLVGEEERAERERRIQNLMERCPNHTDREVLRLRLAGERRTGVFARVLGIEHLPPGEQRRQVKRAKDRIDKMIHRSGGMRR